MRIVILLVVNLFMINTITWPQSERNMPQKYEKLMNQAKAAAQAAAKKAQADPLRPVYHLTAAANWINDPNGPIFFNNEYHVFFQHNPYGPDWGNISWGHVVSRDLVYWKHLPVALIPEPGSYDKDGVFSGCCVIQNDIPTIIYTGVYPEVQCLARSYDNLRTWQKHNGNPVIPQRPRDDLEGFRDPFVWQEGNSWYMALGSGIKGQGGTVLLYKSADLEKWQYLHPLCVGFGKNWECPNFFPLGEKWALIVSPHGDVQYTIGEYRDYHFTPGEWRIMDYGGREGFYAPNCMLDRQGRRIMWGWISGGGSADYPWNGLLTLPRALTFHGNDRLGIAPLPELQQLRGRGWHYKNRIIKPDAANILDEVNGNCLEIIAEIEPGNAEQFGLEVLYSEEKQRGTRICFDNQNLRLSAAEAEGSFQLLPGETMLTLHIFIDKSVIEVYANERTCITIRVFPENDTYQGINLFSDGSQTQVRSLDIWEMGTIWKK